MRVLVTGAAGQLGSTVVARLGGRTDVRPFTRQQLDIADEPAVRDALRTARPDVVINCAAYNDVDGAEDSAEQALAANAMGVLVLARTAAEAGAVLVHYSSDFVFDGQTSQPYVESEVPRPISTYGASKLVGEWFAAENQSAYVLRVESLFGGHPAKSSVDKILTAIRSDQPVRVFANRTVTPSYVDDVADATERLLTARLPFGVYHCVNSGVTTWLGVAQEAKRLLNRQAEIVPVSVTEVKFRAARPQYCALSNQKLRDAGIVMPTWQDALARHVTQSAVDSR
jgi:dTDP-4-dehydrorhamnose reductase